MKMATRKEIYDSQLLNQCGYLTALVPEFLSALFRSIPAYVHHFIILIRLVDRHRHIVVSGDNLSILIRRNSMLCLIHSPLGNHR